MATSNVRMELTAQGIRVVEKMERADALKPLRRELMTATADMAPAVKRVARRLPSQDTRTKNSLRTALANAVQRKVKLTLRRGVMVLITVVPHGGKENLARAIEGIIPWQHPTFGHDPVVDQEPMTFFYKTLQKFEQTIEARVRSVLTKFESEL